MMVTMHFGDGSYKLIEVTSDDPDEAVREAREWVSDNAWFEALDDEDQVAAKVPLSSY
jgi:hypothetical protein